MVPCGSSSASFSSARHNAMIGWVTLWVKQYRQKRFWIGLKTFLKFFINTFWITCVVTSCGFRNSKYPPPPKKRTTEKKRTPARLDISEGWWDISAAPPAVQEVHSNYSQFQQSKPNKPTCDTALVLTGSINHRLLKCHIGAHMAARTDAQTASTFTKENVSVAQRGQGEKTKWGQHTFISFVSSDIEGRGEEEQFHFEDEGVEREKQCQDTISLNIETRAAPLRIECSVQDKR